MNPQFYPRHFTLDPRPSTFYLQPSTLYPQQKPTLVRFLHKYFLMLKLIKTFYVFVNFTTCCARKARASVHPPE